MTEYDTDKYMQDAKGRLVPVSVISEEDKLENQVVNDIMDFAVELNAQIARFKEHCFDDVGTHLDLIGEKYGVKKGGKKGNVSLTNFAGTAKVQIAVQDHMEFGAELQLAKQLIDECITDWAGNASNQVRALVNHAFNVEKTGQVNREALFSLRRLKFDDARWVKAIEAINDSIRITGSKTYIRFYRRAEPTAAWENVTIDIAKGGV